MNYTKRLGFVYCSICRELRLDFHLVVKVKFFTYNLHMPPFKALSFQHLLREFNFVQLLLFINALLWVSDVNLGLKCQANFYKRAAFAAGVQKKPKRCRALGRQRTLNLIPIITQFKTFFLCYFCQTYKECRNQSFKYCNGMIHFLERKVIKVQSLTFFQNIYLQNTSSVVHNFKNHHSSHNCDTILFLKSSLRRVQFHQKKF